eukprot:s2122_g24.t1
MNPRTVSLPDLVAERKRNTALSLSEGFSGAKHDGALAATTQGTWPGRPGKAQAYPGVAKSGVIKEIDLSRMPLSAQREAKNEADVLKRLKHPNIVEYCESFLEGQMLCIVMEYADGGDLSHLIKGRKAASEIICESEALKIFGQICLAIQHVHNQHILHRDLKSQNIFLTQGGCVKLGDFGIAKVLAHTAAEAITMIGTPLYLAPEVCHSQPYGMKADVWSLGVVLYELLALGPPFTGSNLAALINNIVTATPAPLAAVSQSVQDLVSDMLQKTPERRPCIQEVLTRPCIAVFESDCTPQDETFVPQHVQQKIEKHDMADSLEHLLQQTDHGHRRRPPLPESAQMANEFRKNRDAAMAVKARVEGTEGPWQWRRRSRSEEPEHAVSSRKVVDEAEHLRALQEAAAQARRDRRNGQQRLRRELETPRVRDMDSTDYEPARMRASSADEAKHLFDLHEAAAQARRDRRQIQQKLKELEKGPDPCTNQGFEVANSSRPSRTKESRESAEAQHLMALQEARAQARRDRKLIDAKRKAEAEEASENERSESTQNSTVYKPRTPEDRAAAEAKHLQALKDAAAEARRERRMLQQKIQQELGGTSQDEWSGPTPEAGASPYRRRLRQASPSPSPSKLDASSKAACGERKDSSSPEMDGLALSDSLGPLMQSLPRGRADETTAKGLTFYLPLYYRIRQLALNTEKTGHRVPQKMQTELRFLEKSVAREIRSLNPLLFQRFDDVQLDRLLRALPFLRLSMGRWIFGSEQIAAAWPRATSRSFLLMSGKVHLYVDPNGVGERQELTKGAIFGENHFRLGDECMMDIVGGAAQCEEPCIIGVLGNEVLEAAYADRAFGNRKIALSMRHAPALSRVVLPESMTGPHSKIDFASLSFAEKTKILEEKQPGAVKHALEELAKVATQVHLLPGQELLSDPPVEESVVMVSKGSIEVRGDIKLSERLDALPPKRKRMRIFLDKAEKLAGDSIFDKLDPYCIVKLGEFKRFQTPVMWNVGVNPQFEYQGVLTFAEEEELEIIVMDHDKFSADDLCGSCTVKVSDLHDGWYGKVELQRPKRTIGASKDDEQLMEPAGKIYFGVRYDYEKISALTKQAKQRVWPNQVLFNLGGNEAWGHETIMLGPVFQRTLEGAANATAFALELSNFRIIGGYQRGTNEKITLLKTSKKRFVDFVRKSQREKQFMQSCRISALDKQSTVKGIIKVLIERWETEDQADTMRKGLFDMSKVEEAVDPSRFRVAYRGTKAHVSVRNALNLSGGGWFDKLDPYAIVRFRGSKSEFRTSVLQDAGSDPIWNCEGPLAYNGEVALEISVWDYDHYSSDDLVGTGVVQVEQFCNGFEGMVPLSLPSDKKKKKKTLKQSMITIGILWDAPQDPGVRQNEPALGMTAGTKALMS